MKRHSVAMLAALLAVAGALFATGLFVLVPDRDAGTRERPAYAHPFRPDKTSFDSCRSVKHEAFRCIRRAYGNLAYNEGPAVALARLEQERSRTDAQAPSDCHAIAHRIGRAAIARNGSLDEAFSVGTGVCGWGYYHGAMERAFIGSGVEQLKAAGLRVCSGEVVRTVHDKDQCLHGLGHGFAVSSNYDVPRALKACNKLAQTDHGRMCGIGVLMENATLAILNPKLETPYLHAADAVFPCRQLSANAETQQHTRACYLMVNRRWFAQGLHKWRPIIRRCERFGGAAASACVEGTGISLGVESTLAMIDDACRVAKRADLCVRGAAWQMVSDQRPGAARAMCRQGNRPTQPACLKYVDQLQARLAKPAASGLTGMGSA